MHRARDRVSARVLPAAAAVLALGLATATAPATTAPATTRTPAVTSAPAATTPLPGSAAATPSGAAGLLARTHTTARPRRATKISTEAIVLAAIAALAVLACGVWAFARSRAYEPHWMLSFRHAMAEAGFRASATWAEFTDWVRLGR